MRRGATWLSPSLRSWANGVRSTSQVLGVGIFGACLTPQPITHLRSRTGLGPIPAPARESRAPPSRRGEGHRPVGEPGPDCALRLRGRATCSRSRMCPSLRLPPGIRTLPRSPFQFSPPATNLSHCRPPAAPPLEPPSSAMEPLNCLFRSPTSSLYCSPLQVGIRGRQLLVFSLASILLATCIVASTSICIVGAYSAWSMQAPSSRCTRLKTARIFARSCPPQIMIYRRPRTTDLIHLNLMPLISLSCYSQR